MTHMVRIIMGLEGCASAREMADYLAKESLTVDMISDIVREAHISLARKRELLGLLGEESGEKIYADLAGELDIALQELEVKPGDIFYVRECWRDTEKGVVSQALAPFLTLEKAMEAIWLMGWREEGSSRSWHVLEKWAKTLRGELEHQYTYRVWKGEICFFEQHNRLWDPGFSGDVDFFPWY